MMKSMSGPGHSDPGSAHFRLQSAWSKASCSPKMSTRWPSPPPQFQGLKQARGDSLAAGKGSIHPAVASVACTQAAFPDPAERPPWERLSQHPKSHCFLLSFQRKRGGRARAGQDSLSRQPAATEPLLWAFVQETQDTPGAKGRGLERSGWAPVC